MFEGMGEHDKEFCSLLNRAICDDHPQLMRPAALLSRGINALCVAGRSLKHISYRNALVLLRCRRPVSINTLASVTYSFSFCDLAASVPCASPAGLHSVLISIQYGLDFAVAGRSP